MLDVFKHSCRLWFQTWKVSTLQYLKMSILFEVIDYSNTHNLVHFQPCPRFPVFIWVRKTSCCHCRHCFPCYTWPFWWRWWHPSTLSSKASAASHVTIFLYFTVSDNLFPIWSINQELLEKFNIPFVGTQASECRKAFDKVTFSFRISFVFIFF